MKNETSVMAILAAALGALCSYASALVVPLAVLIAVMLADYASGMAKAWSAGKLCSKTGLRGILKKLGYLVLARAGTRVHVVEQDHDKCLRLSQDLPGAMIIEGDGTDIDLIKSENLFGADGFVALTGRDEENLLMALAARRAGVRKVLAKMTRPNYMELVQETGLGSIISPKDIIANQITRYVRALANSQGMAVESLYKLLGGKVEALEFTASNDGNGILHTPLMKLPLRHGVLLAAIVREGRTIIPGGMTTIEPGDHVLVVTNVPGLTDLKNILA